MKQSGDMEQISSVQNIQSQPDISTSLNKVGPCNNEHFQNNFIFFISCTSIYVPRLLQHLENI